MAALAQVGDQLRGTLDRPNLVDQLAVVLSLRLADRVAVAILDVVAGNRGDELVAAHPDVTVDAPDRRRQVVIAERPVPADRVLVVGVDEGAVDVENCRAAHGASLTR